MNELRVAIDGINSPTPFLARLRSRDDMGTVTPSANDAFFIEQQAEWSLYEVGGMRFRLKAAASHVENDVILSFPGKQSAHRLIRSKSRHNTFLITERCDQLCVMCSQPPKQHHVDLFEYFHAAALLAPKGMEIGISGGEPTLYKHALFAMLTEVLEARPDLTFHVLSNGQHFDETDVRFLNSDRMRNVLWAIPIYAADPLVHDMIVGKKGAFDQLVHSLFLFSQSVARLELRTVVLQSNYPHLATLADFIAEYIPFAEFWSIMQLERIGYGRLNWAKEFVDSSLDFANIARALNIAEGRGIEARLYNFPHCTVPNDYRRYAVNSISDWKQKFLNACVGCEAQKICSGFFQWYDEASGFRKIGAL